MIEETTKLYDEDAPLACYDEFRAQLGKLEKENKSLVFDYEDPKGNKDARSHIYKLRRTRTAIDTARKNEKAAALEYGRRVDAEAKEIMERVVAMIDVHQKPLDEIEEREKVRIADIQERIDRIRVVDTPTDLSELRDFLNDYRQIVVDESFDEFMAEATVVKKEGVELIEAAIKHAEEREELERLRREQEERERKEREEQIAAEAAAKAKAEAEAEQQRERERAAEAAARAEAEKQRERERAEEAERAKEAAEARLRQEQEAAARREAEAAERAKEEARRDAEAKAAAEQREREKREADKKHMAKINSEIVADVRLACPAIPTDKDAQEIVVAIIRGNVRHVRIDY